MTFYDLHGRAVAYLYDDGEHIYLFNGKPVAYLYDNAVYGFNGHHLGWFENGWIRDLHGKCVFYTKDAIGGMVKPVCRVTPVKGVKKVTPVRAVRRVARVKAVSQIAWSSLSNERFFAQ